jgi:hypothetical protein
LNEIIQEKHEEDHNHLISTEHQQPSGCVRRTAVLLLSFEVDNNNDKAQSYTETIFWFSSLSVLAT